MSVAPDAFLHPTAEIEGDVSIGSGTEIWDSVHVRGPTTIGRDCIVGEKTYLAPGVRVGDRVKINAFVYLCRGVTLDDGVMVGAGTVFTNDRYPRAATSDLLERRGSEPDERTRPTRVEAGATLGAGCVVGCDLVVGRFAMVGMGSVVTRSIGPHHLALGNPARPVGVVCRCGEPIARFERVPDDSHRAALACGACGRRYGIARGAVHELDE